MLVSTLHIIYYLTVLPHPIALAEDAAAHQLVFVFSLSRGEVKNPTAEKRKQGVGLSRLDLVKDRRNTTQKRSKHQNTRPVD